MVLCLHLLFRCKCGRMKDERWVEVAFSRFGSALTAHLLNDGASARSPSMLHSIPAARVRSFSCLPLFLSFFPLLSLFSLSLPPLSLSPLSLSLEWKRRRWRRTRRRSLSLPASQPRSLPFSHSVFGGFRKGKTGTAASE